MASSEKIALNFNVKNCQKDCSYQIKISIFDHSKEDYINFETESIKCLKENENIIFKKSFNLNFYFDKLQKVKISYFKNNKTSKEQKKTVLSSLICSKNSIYEKLFNKNSNNKDIFVIEVNKQYENNSEISIFDFLKSGLRITGFVSFDFSYNFQNYKDNYMEIFANIIHHINLYNKKGKEQFFLYGYGGKLKNSTNLDVLYKNIFNINSQNKDAPIEYLKLIDEYKKSLDNIISDNKVYYSFLIRKISKLICKLYQMEFYNVLFIIAKELNSEEDNKEAIDAFIETSYLPLSIIIIYEGENDYHKIKNLFGNQIKVSSKGMQKMRNNVILISYSKNFDKNGKRMMESCLREIGNHIIEYYSLNKCTPDKIKSNSMNNIEKSINQYKSSICMYESRISLVSQKQNPLEENDELDDFEPDIMPNISKVQEDLKKNSEGNCDKKNEKETPKGLYIIPNTGTYYPNLINPYNKEKKYTPGNSINSIVLNEEDLKNNPYNNGSKSKDGNQYKLTPGNSINENNLNYNPYNNSNKYKITPGNSLNKHIIQNPYPKNSESKQRFNLTPEGSLNPNINYNPYQKQNQQKETPSGQYILQNDTTINLHEKKLNNPYTKNSNNKDLDKKVINNDSRVIENISTNNSNNCNQSIQNSNYTKFNNYSRDY